MNVAIQVFQFQTYNLFFSCTKKNIFMEGIITKIIYSDGTITTNDVFIITPFYSNKMDKNLSKCYLRFNTENYMNVKTVNELIKIEKKILEYYSNIHKSNKQPIYSLKNQLEKGYVKIYKEKKSENVNDKKTSNYVMKISGVWENESHVGIVFKFFEIYVL